MVAGRSDRTLLMSVTCKLMTQRTVSLVIGTAFVCVAGFVHEPYDLLNVAPGGDSYAEEYRKEKESERQSKLSALIPSLPATEFIIGSEVVLTIEVLLPSLLPSILFDRINCCFPNNSSTEFHLVVLASKAVVICTSGILAFSYLSPSKQSHCSVVSLYRPCSDQQCSLHSGPK